MTGRFLSSLCCALTVSVFSVGLTAQSADHPPARRPHPWLWELRYNGHTSWAVGTMHTDQLDPREFPVLDMILQKVDRLVVESYRAVSFENLSESFLLPPGESLFKNLAPGARKRWQAFLQKRQYQHEFSVLRYLSRFKPYPFIQFLGAELERASIEDAVTYRGDFTFDQKLMHLAIRNGIPLMAMDSHHAFFETPVEWTVLDVNRYIMMMIDGEGRPLPMPKTTQSAQAFYELLQFYINGGDPSELSQLFRRLRHEEDARIPKGLEDFYAKFRATQKAQVARHAQWLSQVKEALAKEPVLIAVGLNHLITTETPTLLDLLRKEGVEIRPVNGEEQTPFFRRLLRRSCHRVHLTKP